MKETSPDSSNPRTFSSTQSHSATIATTSSNGNDGSIHKPLDQPAEKSAPKLGSHNGPGEDDGGAGQPATSPQTTGSGSLIETKAGEEKKPIAARFYLTFKKILFHSWINLLLVFVPVGIAVEFVPNMPPGVIFAMNAIAIIPLAGLLSHATETVAHRLGDTIGALLNVTFGNAVELIIFIALVKDEIRIVQASLLGSILANLLLILGMSFLLGGLRFREQIYNSTVTQMSACLLSLSVISLVLPTAFHASFKDQNLADEQSLKISRGTSVILLLVYIIYLLFQLKSHAYMYESTPQNIIDAESTPGPVAVWLDTSSSDDSSSSDSDSDSSGHSKDTVSKRVKRVIRGGRRRKSSVASMDTTDVGPTRTPSFGTANAVSPTHEFSPTEETASRPSLFQKLNVPDGDESAVEDERPHRHRKRHHKRSMRRYRRHSKRHNSDSHGATSPTEETIVENPEFAEKPLEPSGEPRRVDFALSNITPNEDGTVDVTMGRRPFNALLGMSLKPVAKSLAPTVFTQPPELRAMPPVPTGPVPRVRFGIRRTNSLPDRLNQYQFRPPGAMLPSQVPLAALSSGAAAEDAADKYAGDMSRTSAIILLLVSTGLVAVCAEFMVDSINGLVQTSTISEIFIGLIILPIVGNAAEHVTAITVAMKNKMDLAIGVAVGSSIQIALFITPLVVILGWIMNREMTLYFTLFETVCLFVSAFIVNFLVLDGRSNYLEGALLCATYIIIGVVAFYYPNPLDASSWGA
ncbi:putative ca2+ h+-exchanging protein [Phaeoacremonium minimum UCRPA7]|uniref:Putative ca2+ h+-exchanging protein n=1 Tax=Phaeoacremonium minimum (strain UCR-PA7) TaxID=1286976 RepID=R8BGU5_PHAM7|nr:putative ca2+ h+-exchanging protein [Phaeoacremonium minimum UCRPA7]EON98541.1 putative ca2+ h+-exchanging protein [Phaeoacremonium minimum UCRPA7]